MVAYKIVKYCRACQERFVVEKGQSRVVYCDKCQKKMEKDRAKENNMEETQK
jgi:ribosomal protein S26